mmetsp:Transcript_11060/g.20524  ORF Transcript_11060/g.20524 Transcript_11060/m.20524 type:complete len:147 (+) Transcript_11060:72-512(+)
MLLNAYRFPGNILLRREREREQAAHRKRLRSIKLGKSSQEPRVNPTNTNRLYERSQAKSKVVVKQRDDSQADKENSRQGINSKQKLKKSKRSKNRDYLVDGNFLPVFTLRSTGYCEETDAMITDEYGLDDDNNQGSETAYILGTVL